MSSNRLITLLVDYIQSAYTLREFRQFLLFELDDGEKIAEVLDQTSRNLNDLTRDFVMILRRRDGLGEALWNALRASRRQRAAEVDAVAVESGRAQRAALVDYLKSAYSYEELRRFIRYDTTIELEAIESEAVVTRAVEALHQRELLNEDFFEALKEDRNRRTEPPILAQLWSGFVRDDLTGIRDALAAAEAREQPGGAAFERIVNVLAKFNDPVLFREELARQESRVVRIEVAGKGKGTGWLVGSDLVLTAEHVLPSSLDNVTVLLDYKRVPAATGILERKGRQIALASEPLLASSGNAGVPIEFSEEGPTDATKLDFALLRLAEKVGDELVDGDERSWFRLTTAEHTFEPLECLFVLGHPALYGGSEGGPLKLTFGLPSGATLTPSQTRVRYTLNTEGGNSGSPCARPGLQRGGAAPRRGQREPGLGRG